MKGNTMTSKTSTVPDLRLFGASAQNTAKAQQDHSFSKPAQQNYGLLKLNPSSDTAPPTDNGVVVPVWFSFDLTHRRVQEGGWTHQVTQRELPSSKDIAGVNMHVARGAFRELHWHQADEWALMLYGNARVTVFLPDGTIFVDDVEEGDLWIFPAGCPHSIQGTGEDGCEFLLVFNQAEFSEEITFLISDWLMHTPPDILEKNFGLDSDVIAKIPKADPLYIFPSTAPTTTLAEDQAHAEKHSKGKSALAYTFKASKMKPTYETAGGSARIIDEKIFPASKKICVGMLNIKPGAMREMHWHPNASEWQFWVKGKGRMTVFDAEGKARTQDFNANDVGYVPKMAGHYVENTGDEDILVLEMFATSEFQDISLRQWLRALPPNVASAHTNFSAEDLEKIAFTETTFAVGK
jgi:oxalate decarboxylase